MRTTRTPVRSIGAVAVLALVAAGATACGGTDPLGADQVSDALLTLDNLGEGWTETEPDEEDDSEDAPGCLADIEEPEDDLETVEEAEAAFEYGEQGLVAVETTVGTFDVAEGEIEDAFNQISSVFDECSTVEDTDEEGNQISIELTVDEDKASDDVDNQVNIHGEGTVTVPTGESVPMVLDFTFAQVENNALSVSTISIADSGGDHGAYSGIAIDRLVAVAAGDEPEETTAPAVE